MMNCNVIRDILPLYVDDACSAESKQLVDEHIGTCTSCTEELNRLRNNECVTTLIEQGDNVVLRHAKNETRKSVIVAAVISGILMIPILVCMIVNLATGHGLSWFFIVLTSLLIVASLTVVPLVVIEKKGLWTLGSFTLSLLILFATICIYTGGRWFFIASTSCLFGLSLIFMPFVSRAIETGFWSGKRGLLVCIVDTALLLLMLITIGVRVGNRGYWTVTFSILAVLITYLALMCVALNINLAKRLRHGIAMALSGVFIATAENLVLMILGYTTVWHVFKPFTWDIYSVKPNCLWILFIVFEAIAAGLIISGIKKGKVENVEK